MFKTAVSIPSEPETTEVTKLSEGAFTLVLAVLTALTALSIDMSLPAMPQLQQAFGVEVASVQLTLSLFLLGFAVGQGLSGPLSDRLGRRPILVTGLLLFSAAGLLCAVSPSLPLLVFCRFLQGMGASVGPIMARAMVRDRFDPRQGAAVLSRVTQVMLVAPLLAPTAGSYLLMALGWPSIFLALGIGGALVTSFCWRHLPETLRPTPPGEGEPPSVGAGFRAVLTHESSLRHTLTICFSYAGMFAYISGSPFILMEVFHVEKQHFGFFFAVTAAALMVGATVNRVLVARISPARLLRAGVYLVFGAGLLLAALVTLKVGGLVGVLAPMMVYLFALGLVQPNATAAAMAPHPRLAGVAASLIGSLQTLGGAVAGYCVGAFYDRTPLSLAVTVALLATLTLLVRERGGERI